MDSKLAINPMKKLLAIIAVTGAISLIFIDFSIVSVALVTIQKDLDISHQLVVWIINIYLVIGAAFYLPGSRLADFISSKYVLFTGILTFMLGSIFCAISTTSVLIIVGRLMQGFGGVLLTGPGISLLNSICEKDERNKIIGITMGIASGCLVIAPLLGGFITEYLNWRWIFWVNVPLCALAMVCLFFVPKIKAPNKFSFGSFDFLGMVFAAISIVCLTVLLMNTKTIGGFNLQTNYMILVIVISFLCFIITEIKISKPLMDVRLFFNAKFFMSCILIILLQALVMSTVFWIVFWQHALSVSSVEAGTGMLPNSLMLIVFSMLSGFFINKFGAKKTLLVGASAIFFGFLLSAFYLGVHRISYISFIPALLGLGAGAFFVSNTVKFLAVDFVSQDKKGMAFGILGSLKQLGGAVGTAVLSSIIYGKVSGVGNKLADLNTTLFIHNFTKAFYLLLGISGVIFVYCVINYFRK
jgi:MFS family permease